MKIILMSDSHGDYDAVESIVREHVATADAFIYLGDGLEEFLYAMQKFMVDCYYYVPGNNDMLAMTQSFGDYRTVELEGHRILLTHGHRYHARLDRLGLAHIAALEKAAIVFYGHTHIGKVETIKGIRLINPGSIRYSRSGDPSYAIVELSGEEVKVNFEPVSGEPHC